MPECVQTPFSANNRVLTTLSKNSLSCHHTCTVNIPHYRNYLTFVQGNALWAMGRMDTHPRRMTPEYQNIGSNSLSADGKTIAFVANNDLYVIPVNGCAERQVTFLNAPMAIIQWRDANTIVIASSHNHPFNQSQAHTVCIKTGHVAPMPLGPCTWTDMSSDHHCVIQRHGYGYPSWQRYTGGTAGQLWVKTNASDCFKRILSHIKHNMMHPCIYFLSDHTGVGNIHSCTGR